MSLTFDAWWLPGTGTGLETRTLEAGRLRCRYPVPTPELVDAVAGALRDAGQSLKERPVQEIVASVDAAAARLGDPAAPLRAEAERFLADATGYSPAMVRLVLDRMTADWRAGPLREMLHAELGDPAVLDEFVRDRGRSVRAYGPRLSFHVFAGNVPGVAVTSLVRSLLVKAPALGKLAAGQPVLPVLFARALHDVDPDLASALAVTYWPGGLGPVEARALDAADTIIVYGGEDAVSSIRDRTPSARTLRVHGPKVSVGLVARDARDDPGLPGQVARAIAAFDQHGCVSPHAVLVEGTTDDAARFGEALARALAELQTELPRGRISDAETAAIHQRRGAAELRGHHDRSARVFAPDGTEWTVVVESEDALRTSCLNRFVYVHPVDRLELVPRRLEPLAGLLQSVALAGADDRARELAHHLALAGVSRLATFERLAWPQPWWHHDGRGPLRELLRWVDLEA